MFDGAEELLAKIRLGEDSVLELKAVRFRDGTLSGPRRDELADELAAMVPGRVHYVEARGEGVPLIVERSRELAGRAPVYELFDDELRLTIWGCPFESDADTGPR